MKGYPYVKPTHVIKRNVLPTNTLGAKNLVKIKYFLKRNKQKNKSDQQKVLKITIPAVLPPLSPVYNRHESTTPTLAIRRVKIANARWKLFWTNLITGILILVFFLELKWLHEATTIVEDIKYELLLSGTLFAVIRYYFHIKGSNKEPLQH